MDLYYKKEQILGANDIPKLKGTNKDLLINSYFIGGGSQQGDGRFPINQRGEKSYTYSAHSYQVDMWKCGSITYPGTISLEEYGLRLNVDTFMQQLIENADLFDGKALTVSAFYDDKLAAVTFTWNKNNAYTPVYYNSDDGLQISYNGIYKYVQFYNNRGPSEINLSAVKLEFGSVQTLAHKEDGKWVLNEVPNFQQELSKCQRYQFVVNYIPTGVIGFATAIAPTRMLAMIPVPVTLRSKPTLSFDGLIAYGGENITVGTSPKITGFNYVVLTPNAIRCEMNGQNFISGQSYGIMISDVGKGYFIADANL